MARALPNHPLLTGSKRPWLMEGVVDDCVVVQGEVPADLNGGYYRNGPNMKRPTKQGGVGLSMADGMVHAMTFDEGRVRYVNKWVRTPKYLLEDQHGASLFEWADGGRFDWTCLGNGAGIPNDLTRGVPYGTNMVNVCPFGDSVLALGEWSLAPVSMDPFTLDTIGVVPWGAQLAEGPTPKANPDDGCMFAHPKWDSKTGVLYGLAYCAEAPYVHLEVVEPDGTVTVTALEGVPYASAVHDIWLTERFIVVPIQPLHHSQKRLDLGLSVFGWDPELPILLALVERSDLRNVRWIETGFEGQYILHTMSANHVGDSLELDGPIMPKPPYLFESDVAPGAEYKLLHGGLWGRWTIDLATGKATSEILEDREVEFPKIDERYYGRPYETGFMLASSPTRPLNTIVKRNVRTGATSEYEVAGRVSISEAQFAPRGPDAPEGDGYLLAPVSYLAEHRTDVLIFDTDGIDHGPVATIALPHQTPWTPHGCWKSFG